MTDEKPKIQQPTVTPRTYLVTSEPLKHIKRYLLTRPYGEVVKLMSSLSALTPYNSGGGKDDGKK